MAGQLPPRSRGSPPSPSLRHRSRGPHGAGSPSPPDGTSSQATAALLGQNACGANPGVQGPLGGTEQPPRARADPSLGDRPVFALVPSPVRTRGSSGQREVLSEAFPSQRQSHLAGAQGDAALGCLAVLGCPGQCVGHSSPCRVGQQRGWTSPGQVLMLEVCKPSAQWDSCFPPAARGLQGTRGVRSLWKPRRQGEGKLWISGRLGGKIIQTWQSEAQGPAEARGKPRDMGVGHGVGTCSSVPSGTLQLSLLPVHDLAGNPVHPILEGRRM